MQITDELKATVNAAKKVCVLTGAGVSAESGVPTFRGGGGTAVWKGMAVEEISSARMVQENLPEVWEWFDNRRGVFQDCKPNAAHHALMHWESRVPELLVVTQNIDGLHRAAGSSRIIELHGNIQRSRCTKCRMKYELLVTQVPHEPDICDLCDAPVRPDVVLFGELLPEGAFEVAEQAAGECELFVSIGTSALVFPAAALSSIAKQAGAFCLEINPEETPQSHFFDASLRGKAGEILPELLGINTAKMRT
jgi:NAD-dependent deacetylase